MLAYTFYESDNRVMRYAETLARQGCRVEVVALRKSLQASYERVNGVDIYRIQERHFNKKSTFSYLIQLLRFFIKSTVFLTKRHLRKPYDLIHVHSIPDFLVFATLLPRITGAKVILDIHDIVPELYIEKIGGSRSSFLFKILILVERASTGFAHHVIVANHLWYEKLISRSVPPEKCTVILNYPDQNIFYAKTRLNPNGSFIVVYPGSLNWHQGVDTLIKAFGLLKDRLPEAELHLYGSGNNKPDLMNLSSALGLESKVLFNEELPLDEIVEVMRGADVAVEPKKAGLFTNEALSTKILEFMSLGVPVIASDTLAHRYYFNDSQILFFKSDDEGDLARCLVFFKENKDLRLPLLKNSLDYIQDNCWQKKEGHYLRLVGSTVESADYA